MSETIFLRDRRQPDEYADVPLVHQTWFMILQRQLMLDDALRVALPVPRGPVLAEATMALPLIPAQTWVVVQSAQRATKPAVIGVAGLLPKGMLEVYTPCFASIFCENGQRAQEEELLALVYRALAETATMDLQMDGVLAQVVPGLHARALDRAGYQLLCERKGVWRDQRKARDTVQYVREAP